MKKRKGYEWRGTPSGAGYWSKMSGEKHPHKLPFFCPYEDCRRPTSTIDNEFIEKYGICARCYTMHVDERENPLIDVEYYTRRFKERGN